MIYLEGDFEQIAASLHHKLLRAEPVDTGHWQSLKNVPHTATRELRNVVIETPMPPTKGGAQWFISPNLPWAEDHFQERIGGEPLNPGEQYMNWPWYRGGVEDHKGDGTFSHTYMERFWPKELGHGIRYRYGDLNDVIGLLAREPHTRQAWFPIWFPEDTGAHFEGRVPCSIGYHFMLRDGRLNCSYVMRSCDFLRYFRDDVYLTIRLAQHVLDCLRPMDAQAKLEGSDALWENILPGTLHMTMYSLHVFEGDMPKMNREAPEKP